MLHKEEQLGIRYFYCLVTRHRDFQRTAALVMLSGYYYFVYFIYVDWCQYLWADS